jgi:(2R)-sulfolactate sulfo-lyase subunit alpha
MKKAILLHEASDDVGVAVMDLVAEEEVEAVTLEGKPVGPVKVTQDIPLSHKVAMREMKAGEQVKEYGRAIGCATQDIQRGAHVHVHNLKSLRWKSSQANALER